MRVDWSGDLGDLFGGGGGFSDFFRTIFGGTGGGANRPFGGARPRAVQGQDMGAQVEITLEEAFHGTTRTLERDDGKKIRVKIPPGARTGSKVRVAGKGSSGFGGGSPGDLYLNIQIKPHPIFRRDGDNLRCDVTADLYTAVLGGEVQVPTLKGNLALKIPSETQNGRIFRLSGQGMPHLGKSSRGDLLAKVRVVLPTKLTAEEKKLFEQLSLVQSGKKRGDL